MKSWLKYRLRTAAIPLSATLLTGTVNYTVELTTNFGEELKYDENGNVIP